MKKKKTLLVLLFCIVVLFAAYHNIFATLKKVDVLKKEKKELASKLNNLKEQGETLKVEANKLQDSEYVAKYAREKFLYSGKNEYIIKIE